MQKLNKTSFILLGICTLIGVIILASSWILGAPWTINMALSVIGYIFIFNIVISFALLVIMLSLSMFKKTDQTINKLFTITSYIFGIIAWVYSFMAVYTIWGYIGTIVGLILGVIGIIPVAILAIIINQAWDLLILLVLGIMLTLATGLIVAYISKKRGKWFWDIEVSRVGFFICIIVAIIFLLIILNIIFAPFNKSIVSKFDSNVDTSLFYSSSTEAPDNNKIDCSCETTFKAPYPVEWSGEILSTFVSGQDLGVKRFDQSGKYKQFYVDGNNMYKGDTGDSVRVKGKLIGITCAYANTVFRECVGEVAADSIEKIK